MKIIGMLFLILVCPSLIYGSKNRFLAKIRNKQKWISEEIREVLAPFYAGINLKKYDNWKSYNDYALVKVSIINNIVSIEFGNRTSLQPINDLVDGRCHVMQKFFQEIASYVKLPDLQFFLHVGDGFFGNSYQMPVFAFSKHKFLDPMTILIPDPDMIGFKHFYEIEMGKTKYPWGKKIDKAFWRGSTTGGNYSDANFETLPRLKIVKMTQDFSSYLDAKFVTVFDPEIKNKFIKLGYVSEPVSISDHLEFKYQLLIDGNTSAWNRALWQLFSDCVIFKQESYHVQWFYSQLIPYENYIPFDFKTNDLIEKILWARNNDEAVKRVVKNANQFAYNNMTLTDFLAYSYFLLIEYSKLLLNN